MTNLDQKIAALEQRVSQLERTRHPRPAPLLPPQQQVSITYPTAMNAKFVMPDDDALVRLHRIVIDCYPNLQAKDEDFALSHPGFSRAFWRLAHMDRTDALDEQYDLLSWVDAARNWLRERGQASRLTALDFIAAAAAHGDVEMLDPSKYPACSGFGLATRGGGRPACDGWRVVLDSRRCRPPVESQQVRRAS